MSKSLLLLIFILGSFIGPGILHSVDSRPVMRTNITGGDELYDADVTLEDGVKKLQVKASIVPELGDIFQEPALNGVSAELNVNGSLVTPINFDIIADPTRDKIVQSCILYFDDGGIKLQNFVGQNSPLTNGLTFTINADGAVFVFLPIFKTTDINNHFATVPFTLVFASGGDYVSGRFAPATPFTLKAGTGDFVRISIRDNLNNVSGGELICNGIFD